MEPKTLKEAASFLPLIGAAVGSVEHRAPFHLAQPGRHFLSSPSTTTMTSSWPFKKTLDPEASSSWAKKKSPSKKMRKRPYLNVDLAQALFDQKKSVGVRDVHLPGGWLLNTRRVSIPPMLRRGRERHDEIRRRQAILPQDLQEDPTFVMDSEWWDRPAYEPCMRHHSGLLGDEEYDYNAPADAL
jgi:hypothetical protein